MVDIDDCKTGAEAVKDAAAPEKRPRILHNGIVKSLWPYKDICAIKSRREELTAEIVKVAHSIDLLAVDWHGFIRVCDEPDGERIFSGYGKIGSRVCFGEMEESPDFAQIAEGAGAFEYFDYKDGAIRAASDFFGLSAIYAYEDEYLSLLTNRAHLAAVFASLSGAREINYPLIHLYILSGTCFKEQTNLNATPIKNLYRLNAGEYAVLRDKIESFAVDPSPIEGSRDGLLDESFREARETREGLRNALPEYSIIFDLSGGKGTRLNLAPFLNESLKIRTYNAPRSADTRVSQAIVSIFPNLTYNSSFSGKFWPVSGLEAIRVWRSYSFGFRHALDLPAFAKLGSAKEIAFSGAYNIFGHYFNWKAGAGLKSLTDWAKAFFASPASFYANLLTPEEREAVLRLVLEDAEARFANCGNLDEALTAFYRYGGWRDRFGDSRMAIWRDCLRVYPCLNRYSLAAAERQSGEDRSDGKFFYDYTSHASRVLANIDCASPWPAQIKNRTFIPRPEPERLEKVKEDFAAAWAEYDGERAASLAKNQAPTPPGFPYLHLLITKAMVRISSVEPGLGVFCAKMYGLWTSEYDWTVKRSVFSKLLALDDYLLPLESMKTAFEDEEKFLTAVAPVSDFSIDGDTVSLRLFRYLNPDDFLFGLRVYEAGGFSDYPLQTGLIFKIAQKAPVSLGIRSLRKNRPGARAKFIQRKIRT